MIWSLWSLMITMAFAAPSGEAFLIQINDRNMVVTTPSTKNKTFAVIVENKSLTEQVAKFVLNGKALKFISVAPGNSESVEIENPSARNVTFVPVSPAFQDVELIFGKKSYEVPSKE